MRIRTAFATAAVSLALPILVACGATDDSTTASTSSSSSTSQTSQDTTAQGESMPQGGGPGGSVDLTSVDTVEELDAVVQDAYGEASLGLHRGHQPIEDVLDAVLEISHDELHVRMEEQGQNLAAVAEDLGIDPQTLVDALVEKYSAAVDAATDADVITDDQADAYLDALEEAFTWRISWDGSEATPTFDGIDA